MDERRLERYLKLRSLAMEQRLRAAAPGLTRRGVLRLGLGLGALGLAGVVAGCGQATTTPTAPAPTPTQPTTTGGGATPAGQSGQVVQGFDPEKVKTQRLRTIGLSVTVQDRILDEFKNRYGVAGVSGTTATLDVAMNRVIANPAEFDVNETIGERVKAQAEAGVLQPIPLSAIPLWQYVRDFFKTPDPRWPEDRQIYGMIYTDDRTGLWMVPTVFNFDSIGYRPDLIDEPTSWADWLDDKHHGKAGLNVEPLTTFPRAFMALRTLGLVSGTNPGNPTREEIDTVVDYLIEKKRKGFFRAIWGDFGELVNLMASGEVVIADAWQPAVMAVKAQGIPCRYAVPKEGYVAWSIGISVVKDTPNYDAAVAYIDFWLSGWPAITVSEQGYYSPYTTIKDQMDADLYGFWYEGKPWSREAWRGIQPGELRDGGSLEERAKNIGVWEQWPDEYDYLTQRWDELLTA